MAVLDIGITSPRTGQIMPASSSLTVTGFLRPDNTNLASLMFAQISWAGGVLATTTFTHSSNTSFDWTCSFGTFTGTPVGVPLTLNIAIQRGSDQGQACSVFTRASG